MWNGGGCSGGGVVVAIVGFGYDIGAAECMRKGLVVVMGGLVSLVFCVVEVEDRGWW